MELVGSVVLPLVGRMKLCSIRQYVRRTTRKYRPDCVCRIPYFLRYKCDVLFRNTCLFDHNIFCVIVLSAKIDCLSQVLKLPRQ